MRISTAWAQQLSVDAMAGQQTKLAKVQQQLSSGLKVSTPAEDPAAAVRILDLDRTIAKTNQYQNNIATTRDRLNIEESALGASVNILGRAKELAIQAMTPALSSSDKLTIKTEVDQMILGLVDVANTKNANGEFIFSGDLSTVPAFAIHPTTGEYVYQGGPQQRALQISPTRQVADGDLGFNVFENISSSSPAADENGKRSIFNTLKALSEGLSATFNASPAEITGDRFLRYGLDYTAPLSTITAPGQSDPKTVTSFNFNTAAAPQVDGTNTSAFLGVGGGGQAALNFSGASNLAQFNVNGASVTLTQAYATKDALALDIQNQLQANTGMNGYTAVFAGNDLVITNTGSTAAVEVTFADTNAIAAGFVNSAGAIGAAAVPTTNAAFSVDGTSITLDGADTNITGVVAEINTKIQTSTLADKANYLATLDGSGKLVITHWGSTTPVSITVPAGQAGTNATNAGITGSTGIVGTVAEGTAFDLVANVEMLPATVPATLAAITAPINLTGKKFTGVDGMVSEINAQLAATPGGLLSAAFITPNTNFAAGSHFSDVIQVRSNGNRIEFFSVVKGETSSITINNTSGTFLTDAGFSDGQSKTGAGAQTFQSQFDDVLKDLDAAQDSFLQARTSVGVRMNALDDQESQNEKFVLDTKITLSETQDLDYAEAISRFQLQTAALQAAQQTFSKVRELSLFNYL
ncbi:MAG: flagellar hook-associated protein FlgL [Methylobacter sp.]|nr:flagellar hook-associated protein FlgL [Methylobacter sp.]